MHGHPVARAMEEWHRAHNGKHDDEEWHAFLDDFTGLLAVKNEEHRTEHTNESRFGMSKAGGCTRAAALKYLDEYEPEPFSGSDLFTFWLGHQCEIAAVATLKRLGMEMGESQEPVRIDPFMHSFSDQVIIDSGRADIPQDTVLSVKSGGYKKSGKEYRNGKTTWVRRGFPSYPFEGVKKANPSAWCQAQAEMHGSGRKNALVVVVSKDIIKAMADDPYLGEQGNGSLTFYAELIPYDQRFCDQQLVPIWNEQWKQAQDGHAGPAKFFNGTTGRYVDLKQADLSWMPNASSTGSFNPCAYCDVLKACNQTLASEWRERRAAEQQEI